MRELKYKEALSEGLVQAMEADERVFVMGIGVDDPRGIFGTTLAAARKFGPRRVMDIPIAEDAITGAAIGAALAGMRPVLVHARNDFMVLSMNELINHAAKWSYLTGGAMHVPLTVRAIIGRGWGQGPQHSQSLQAFFMHAPGIKVVMPATPYDAKGLLIASIAEDCPVVVIEHRQLYEHPGPVPQEPYRVPLGQGVVRRRGRDATVVAVSLMVSEALQAAQELEKDGVEVEVVDPRTISPLDEELILDSVKKTGRLVVGDVGGKTCGVSAEIAALVAEKAFGYLKTPVVRVALPHVPTPTSVALETLFYPRAEDIASAVRLLVRERVPIPPALVRDPVDKDFRGPF